jgi:hypothetical protein
VIRVDELSPLLRLGLFAALLAVVAAVAALAGQASGIDVGDDASTEPAHGSGESAAAYGLSDTASGFGLQIDPDSLSAGAESRLRLTIVDDAGDPFTGLRGEGGEPPLHLILVRRDLTGYQHLHPRPAGDGFAVDVTLPRPGSWRAYADFEVDGEKVVLGRDLVVPGGFSPQPPAALTRSATAGGYRIELGDDVLHAGTEATLTFRIDRNGRRVDGLEPYLGAAGHLVAIREDDLAYLHVHPLDALHPGELGFDVELDRPGRYKLYLQFKHRGRVQTAVFAVAVSR